MFGTLGGQEILLIVILGLIVFGPRKLPEIGKTMGKMLAEFRKASNDFRQTVENEVEADRLRTELAEQASSAPAPTTPPATTEPPVTETTSEAAPAAIEPPAAQMAEGAASADATPAPAALHPPAESVSRE